MLALRTFTIARLTGPGGGSKKLTFVATGGDVSGFLESSSAEFAAIVDGEFGRTFSLFSDDIDQDVKIGDRLTDEDDGSEYDVKGVLRNGDGPGRKMQIALTLPAEQ